MCKVLEEMCREEREEERKETLAEVVQMLLTDGTQALDKIIAMADLTADDIKRLQRDQEQTI